MIVNGSTTPSLGAKPLARQRGVVMYVALIVLIAMTLAGIAMMRQMNAGVSVAGNVAFKQNATSVADQGVEAAHAWYTSTTPIRDLNTTAAAQGYYSSWGDTGEPKDDPTTFPWDDGSVTSLDSDADPTANRVRYILQRLCAHKNASPSAVGQKCSDSGSKALIRDTGGDPLAIKKAPVPYFRVTVRVDGPRNTVSYVQVIMN